MEWLFASGHVVDVVLAVLALEALVLAAWHRRTGRGIPLPSLLAFLLSGACLLLALRVALTDGWWGWIGLFLAAAGVMHALELRTRWNPQK